MAEQVQIVYRDSEDHQEWKRAQAALLAAAHKEADMLRHAIKNAKQELATGRPDWAAETLRQALFPPKEEIRGRFLG